MKRMFIPWNYLPISPNRGAVGGFRSNSSEPVLLSGFNRVSLSDVRRGSSSRLRCRFDVRVASGLPVFDARSEALPIRVVDDDDDELVDEFDRLTLVAAAGD